jgi:hypothetical protein
VSEVTGGGVEKLPSSSSGALAPVYDTAIVFLLLLIDLLGQYTDL